MFLFFSRIWAQIRSHQILAVWFGVSLALIVMGPFGTYLAMPLDIRAVYWPGLVAVSIIIAYAIRCVLWRLLGDKLSIWVLEPLRVIAFSAAFAPIVELVSEVIMAQPIAPVDSIRMYWIPVLLIATFVTLVRIVVIGLDRHKSVFRPRLADRLPADAGGRILRLSVDDHYVEVFLDNGEYHRILMRFADAIAEMEGVDGHCAHRSHWVVDAEVTGSERRAGRDFLMMSDGSEVPVSRKYRPGLVDAGMVPPPAPKKKKKAQTGSNGTAIDRFPVNTATPGE